MSVYRESMPKMRLAESLDQAIQRAKHLLFRPFDISTWFQIGLMVFMEGMLYTHWSGAGFQSSFPTGQSGGAADPSQSIRAMAQWVETNLAFCLTIGAAILVASFGLYILLAWAGSHGQTMFVHAIGSGQVRVADNWRATSRVANSLFRFRIVLGLLTSAIAVSLLVTGAIMSVSLANQGTAGLLAFAVGLLPVLLSLVFLGIGYGVLNTVIHCFLTPLMVRFDLLVGDGWRLLRDIARGNVGPMALLVLIRFVYYIPFNVAAATVTCLTCCLGGIPVIHQTLFAPFYVFDRAFSLYAIQSLGPEFRMIDADGIVDHEDGYRPAPLMDEFDDRNG